MARTEDSTVARSGRVAVGALICAVWLTGCGSRSDDPSVSPEQPAVSSEQPAVTMPATTPTSAVATSDSPPVSSVPTAPTGTAAEAVGVTEWLAAQEAERRDQGYVTPGVGIDADVVVAYAEGAATGTQVGVLLPSGVVVALPSGVSTTRFPFLAGLDGRPVVISPLDSGHEMWILDPTGMTWMKGPEVNVFTDRQSIATVAVLGDRLIVANQTRRDNGSGYFVPDRFEGVIIDSDLQTTAMAQPPAVQFLSVTTTLGVHALMLGLDSAADSNAPLTQPWQFDVTTNEWTAVPQPEWLACRPDCNWRAPHEGSDSHLEVIVDGRVVMLLPDGTVGAYDPDARVWTRFDDPPFQLSGPAVAVLGQQIAVVPMVTGYGPNDPGVAGVLDTTTGQWTTGHIEVGTVAPGDYIPLEARTDGTTALFNADNPRDQAPDTVVPDAVYEANSRTWRLPAASHTAYWAELGKSIARSGSLRELLEI